MRPTKARLEYLRALQTVHGQELFAEIDALQKELKDLQDAVLKEARHLDEEKVRAASEVHCEHGLPQDVCGHCADHLTGVTY